MAVSNKKVGSKEDAIHNAVEDIRSGKCSFRKAELKYGIPRSTLNDYTTGRVEIGKRQGPQPVLRKDEELYLVNWAVEMNKIGYGQTRRQICEMVKKILDKDGRPNPFKDNRPGKDWWYAFLARNNLTIRSPSSLEMYRVSACTKQNLESWYARFEQFLSCHSLLDEPDRIWNYDESGFPLCPKSGRVLAPIGTKVVYSTCSAQKGQITTLVAICASGRTIPPMHIFPGKRFSYNPMEGGSGRGLLWKI